MKTERYYGGIFHAFIILSLIVESAKAANVRLRVSPASNITNPSARGSSAGRFTYGGSFTLRNPFPSRPDGAVYLGLGIGDPDKWVGVQLVLTLPDPIGDVFETGLVTIKIHRSLPERFSVAVGQESFISWGDPVERGASSFVVVTKSFRLRDPEQSLFGNMVLTAGLGNGRFLPNNDVITDRGGFNGPFRPFASLKLGLGSNASLIIDWIRNDYYAGVSFVPFSEVPLILLVAVGDVHSPRYGDGIRYLFSFAYGGKIG